MAKFATVVIPFAYTQRWGQISLASLKKFKNERDFDILVMNNSPHVDAIKALTDTSLGDGVKFHIPEKHRQRWHAGSLDRAISMIDTPYMFTMETDCTVNRDGWLDWYASLLPDKYAAMAGYFWKDPSLRTDDGRHYINSSGTIYRTEVLLRLLDECTSNKDEVISYGMNCEKRMEHDVTMTMIREGELGPFSDSRGFFQVDAPAPRPDKWWHEPGSWLYCRCKNQYECIKVAGGLVKNPQGMQPEVNHSYCGHDANNPFLVHYFGGTVSHNYEKHLVTTPWEVMASKWWLRREMDMWEAWVPQDVREYSIKNGLVRSIEEDLEYARRRMHLLEPGMHVRVYRSNATDYITKEKPEPNNPDDGLLAYFAFWEGNGMRVVFEDKVIEPYQGQFMEGGKVQLNVHPNRCVRA